MASEFDDLFDSSDISYSKSMAEGKGRLVASEELFDRIFGSPYSGIPVHSGIGNLEALTKAFGTDGKPAPTRTQPTRPFTPSQEPIREPDPLSDLMQEFDRRPGSEMLKQTPQPRSESKHFKPIIEMVSTLKGNLRKHYSERAMEEAEKHWPEIVKSAMTYVEEQLEA